jgi:hypothetical protein
MESIPRTTLAEDKLMGPCDWAAAQASVLEYERWVFSCSLRIAASRLAPAHTSHSYAPTSHNYAVGSEQNFPVSSRDDTPRRRGKLLPRRCTILGERSWTASRDQTECSDNYSEGTEYYSAHLDI